MDHYKKYGGGVSTSDRSFPNLLPSLHNETNNCIFQRLLGIHFFLSIELLLVSICL